MPKRSLFSFEWIVHYLYTLAHTSFAAHNRMELRKGQYWRRQPRQQCVNNNAPAEFSRKVESYLNRQIIDKYLWWKFYLQTRISIGSLCIVRCALAGNFTKIWKDSHRSFEINLIDFLRNCHFQVKMLQNVKKRFFKEKFSITVRKILLHSWSWIFLFPMSYL